MFYNFSLHLQFLLFLSISLPTVSSTTPIHASSVSTCKTDPPSPTIPPSDLETYNVTTIAARDNASILQCWQLNSTFVKSTTPGIVGGASIFFGDAANATLTVLPGEFAGGLHNAPVVQFVYFVSGLAHITLPNSTDEAWAVGGQNGLLLAVDVAAVSTYGHNTTYPSDELTTAFVVPTRDGEIPAHIVLHEGACGADEIVL